MKTLKRIKHTLRILPVLLLVPLFIGNNMKRLLVILIFVFIIPNDLYAQTFVTNKRDVVINNVDCSLVWNNEKRGRELSGTIVNKNLHPLFPSILTVKVYDEDGDPIGGGIAYISLDRESGKTFTIPSTNCSYQGTSYKFHIKESQELGM